MQFKGVTLGSRKLTLALLFFFFLTKPFINSFFFHCECCKDESLNRLVVTYEINRPPNKYNSLIKAFKCEYVLISLGFRQN